MIQRIQTLYLLLAAILPALLFFLPIGHTVFEGTEVFSGRVMAWGWELPAGMAMSGLTIASTILLAVSVLLALFTVFRYRNRRQQKRLCSLLVLLLLAFVAVEIFYGLSIANGNPAPVLECGIAGGFPLVSVVLALLARRGIVKDDKLVRSLDRIR